MHPSASKSLNGIETEVAILNYSDRVLVLVTQLGKVGNMVRCGSYYFSACYLTTYDYVQIQASIPATVPLLPSKSTEDGYPLIEPSPAIELTSLFGSAPSHHIATLHSLYASHIATLLWTMASQRGDGGDRRNIVVGLALKRSQEYQGEDARLSAGEQTTFKGVVEMIVELLQGTKE